MVKQDQIRDLIGYTPIGTKTGGDVIPQNEEIANKPTARN
jgi:hypothetical protein